MSTSPSIEYELIEKIKSNDHVCIERVRRVSDGTLWIRRVYADDRREVFRALASIKDKHVPYIEEMTFDSDTTIIEERVDGVQLRERLLRKNFSRKQVLSISKQLFSVLKLLHDQSIIHRDIKPENILISPDDNIHLIDFGIARIYRPDSTQDTSLFGTAGYAAPEQYGFSQTDPRSDVYSSGIVVRELCKAAGIDENDALHRLAIKCSSFDPNNRCNSAEEALRELSSIRTYRQIATTAALFILVLLLGSVLLSKTISHQGKSEQEATSPSDSHVTIRFRR